MDYRDRFEDIHGDEDYSYQQWSSCDIEEQDYQACYDLIVEERIDELKEEEIRMMSKENKDCSQDKECNDESFHGENRYLFLEMKLGEKIYINNEMYIQFIKQNSPRAGSEKIRMGFHAPRHIVIDREVIYLRKQAEQRERIAITKSANDESKKDTA